LGDHNVKDIKRYLALGYFNMDEFNQHLSSYVLNGKLELVKLIIQAGANDIDNALAMACIFKHRNILEYFVSDRIINKDDILKRIKRERDVEWVDYLRSLVSHINNDI
jgi:hypothetical protein